MSEARSQVVTDHGIMDLAEDWPKWREDERPEDWVQAYTLVVASTGKLPDWRSFKAGFEAGSSGEFAGSGKRIAVFQAVESAEA